MRVNLKQVFYYVGAFLFFYFFFTCQEKISPDLLGLNRVMPRDRALWEAVIQTTVSPKIKKTSATYKQDKNDGGQRREVDLLFV